ncbi:glycosyltransferase family 2 protein [Paenibacillus guangzhouensis]|uniref:glycosyltransferase family 2 protein n=1 Tax=Paenibacillus guangzhouensis TaxID=1473112 RepID=UPI00126746B5|nr:glycosyltransferase family 2 protein [Paenibacillus guangzhouensis]
MSRKRKVTLSMVVRNEAGRYLERMLQRTRAWIDEAVIIDDASSDDTVELCCRSLPSIPVHIVQNTESSFHQEAKLRRQQWEETVRQEPDWILNLDADELIEARFATMVEDVIEQDQFDLVGFRLYDMWNETSYRDDMYWQAHRHYWPFMIRYRPQIDYSAWREQGQHCGRFPIVVDTLPCLYHTARIQHFGWAREGDRITKYGRYLRLDPGAQFGWKEQYDSILDPFPVLRQWT